MAKIVPSPALKDADPELALNPSEVRQFLLAGDERPRPKTTRSVTGPPPARCDSELSFPRNRELRMIIHARR